MNLILQNCCKNEDQELSLSSGIVSHLTADAKGNSTLMDSCLFYWGGKACLGNIHTHACGAGFQLKMCM